MDLVGFGMAFPDVQLRAESLGARGELIGIILASLFVVQTLTSPKWGAVSDRFGRKPIFLLCTTLSASSMAIYAVSGNLWLIFLSRIVAGLGGANVAIAQAYAAESTAEGERGKAMARMGAAVTSGILVGPAIGGKLSAIGGNWLLGWVACAASVVGCLLVAFLLPSRTPDPGQSPPRKKMIFDVTLLREIPEVRPLFLLAAVAWFALACLEGTFGRLLNAKFDFPLVFLGMTMVAVAASGFIFSLESGVSALIQTFALDRLTTWFSESRLLPISYFLQGLGLLLTPFMPELGLILVCSLIYSVGTAIANPTVNTAASKLVSDRRQGELFGLMQGARSLGFMVGPIVGGALFDAWNAGPYVLAGGVSVVAAVLAAKLNLNSAR